MMEMEKCGRKKIEIRDKNKTIYRYLIGGFIFGLGWALAGACPVPLYSLHLLGARLTEFIIYLLAAMTGTFVYGMLRKNLH
ncbi:MAG: YeeE/YedE family protein [Bacteroidetes bacterium]|nr:YeeE/YedE family protein [Bacteroidota bacterium]